MGTSARVTSVEAVQRFRQALVFFTDEISGALFSLRSEILRTQEWIEHECPHYWRDQTRVAFDAIASARSNLETAQMRGKVAGHHPSCYDEQVALRKAKQRLQYAQDQIEVARRWGNKFRHEAEEYKGCLGKLQHLLDNDLILLQTKLDGMIGSLEAYLASQPVETSPPSPIPRFETVRRDEAIRPTPAAAADVSTVSEQGDENASQKESDAAETTRRLSGET